MPMINLIQEQRLLTLANERKARLFFGTFVGASCLSVIGFGYLLYQNDQLTSEQSRLQAKAQKVAPMVSEIEEKQALLDTMTPKLTTLQDAQKTTSRWNRVLSHLATQTPPHTWLTNMRCTATDPTHPISVTFNGVSAKQELIGEFILRLQGSPDLVGVGLHFTQEKTASSGAGLEFEIAADLDGTAEEQTAKVQEEKG